MKNFQFSLRTLIIVTFIAGIGVWFGVQHYLQNTYSQEMYDRSGVLSREVDKYVSVTMYTYGQNRKSFSSSSGGSSSFLPQRWEMSKEGTVTIDNVPKKIFCFRISCDRTNLTVQPIEFVYDGSSENDGLMQKLKAICYEKKWPCVLRKIDSLKE